MGKLPLGKLSFGKMYIWEVAAWKIALLGSCHLGKYPWKVAAWEKAFMKVPNINLTPPVFFFTQLKKYWSEAVEIF